MDVELFAESQKKHLIKTLGGAWAYVPPPLPPRIDLGPIAHNLTLADRAMGELRGAARRLQNPYILIMPLIRKEALTSSAIEGTITTINDMLLEEAAPDQRGDENAKEAFNYVDATIQSTQRIIENPISQHLIKEAHAILLSGLSSARGSGKKPGEYKTQQNAVGQLGDNESSARYVPPPTLQSADCMATLETFINRTDRKPGEELIDIALAHYQFEAIHPFNDGNGRIGRMLITLMAQKLKLLDQPLLHISANIEPKKPAYVEKLFDVSSRAGWTEWINFFLGAVQESCETATEIVDTIIDLQSSFKKRALEKSGNHRLQTIIDGLFAKNWTTAGETQKRCDVTFPTAQSDLKQLVEAGIVNVIEDVRPAIYFAPEIMKLSSRK